MATRRVKIGHDTPLETGVVYDIEGPVRGNPTAATKKDIEKYLNENPGLKGAKIQVLDWASSNTKTWVVRFRVISLPSPTTTDLPTTAVAPIVVIAVTAIIAALVAFAVWQYISADVYKFQQVPDGGKTIAYLGTSGLLPIAVLALVGAFVFLRNRGGG